MTKKKNNRHFVKAKTPEARNRQKKAIARYYANKKVGNGQKRKNNVDKGNDQKKDSSSYRPVQVTPVPQKKPNKKNAGDVDVLIKRHMDKKGGHYHVILENIDDKHVSVGLTTDSKKGKNSTNYKLEKSPFLDGENSFLKRQGTVDLVVNYDTPLKGVMSETDFKRTVLYGERAKQKYIASKKK